MHPETTSSNCLKRHGLLRPSCVVADCIKASEACRFNIVISIEPDIVIEQILFQAGHYGLPGLPTLCRQESPSQ